MQTNEITKLLGIKKSHLRFLRDKKLFQPKTAENGYQYYTDDDAKNIKRLLIIRKAGVSIKLIQDLQSGNITTAEALKQTEQDLEAALKELQGSLSFCRSLQENDVAYESMDVDYYWDEIQRKEQEGEHFVDVLDYYMLANISLERDVECPHCREKNKIDFSDYLVDELHYDRPMGNEIQYCFDIDEYECDSCGVHFRVAGSINEYPFGAYDSEHIDIEEKNMEGNNVSIKDLLKNLAEGLYDGERTDSELNGVSSGFYIDEGTPVKYREGKSSKFFDGKENIRIPGKVEKEYFDSNEKKTTFLKKYGFIQDMFGNHPDVMDYSHQYYENKKKKK